MLVPPKMLAKSSVHQHIIIHGEKFDFSIVKEEKERVKRLDQQILSIMILL